MHAHVANVLGSWNAPLVADLLARQARDSDHAQPASSQRRVSRFRAGASST